MTAGGGDRAEARGDFGGVAATYATFRPAYPRALYAHLAAVVRRRHRAWDCGAGSGQATLDLATSFEHVVASDLSEAQLACMPRRPNVDRVVCRAGASALVSHCFDGPFAWRAAAALALALPAGPAHGLAPHPALDAWEPAALPLEHGELAAWNEPGLGAPARHGFA